MVGSIIARTGGNRRRGKCAALCVLADELLVRGEVNAVDLVVRHVAMDPLDVGSELIEGDAGPRRPACSSSRLSDPIPGIGRSMTYFF
jgi:hypothetical protein